MPSWLPGERLGRGELIGARVASPEAAAGPWRLEAQPGTDGDELLDAEALGSEVLVRPWRPGDRMRPAGLGGSKTLQDLFVDRKVPRTERASWPVIEASGEIACVPAVAVGERFRPREQGVIGLSATRSA